MTNELSRLSELYKTHTIEELLAAVPIEDIEDFTIRMIFRTIDLALTRLHEELN